MKSVMPLRASSEIVANNLNSLAAGNPANSVIPEPLPIFTTVSFGEKAGIIVQGTEVSPNEGVSGIKMGICKDVLGAYSKKVQAAEDRKSVV